MSNHQIVMLLLNQLEQQLQQTQMWQEQPPSAEALASTEPFCIDTLSFEQWLQFVLIPRIRTMIAQGQPLPTKIAIAPMAEQSFAGRNDLMPLIVTLSKFDLLLSQSEAR